MEREIKKKNEERRKRISFDFYNRTFVDSVCQFVLVDFANIYF